MPSSSSSGGLNWLATRAAPGLAAFALSLFTAAVSLLRGVGRSRAQSGSRSLSASFFAPVAPGGALGGLLARPGQWLQQEEFAWGEWLVQGSPAVVSSAQTQGLHGGQALWAPAGFAAHTEFRSKLPHTRRSFPAPCTQCSWLACPCAWPRPTARLSGQPRAVIPRSRSPGAGQRAGGSHRGKKKLPRPPAGALRSA